jgi:proteasome assembly chaperone (PAC2) family protein
VLEVESRPRIASSLGVRAMVTETWIKYLNKPKLREPLAVVGSPGLRSIGEYAIKYLVNDHKSTLTAELYSSHFPVFYQTSPSYVPFPGFPGESGVTITQNHTMLPRVELYYSITLHAPDLIIAKGIHANFYGQYEVAEKVLDFFEEFGVKGIIVLAGYGRDGEDVCCAATNLSMIEEMKKLGIEKGYEGPFYGFSGLVFGLATLRGIKAVCLFGRTKPNPEYPEDPDPSAAKTVLQKLHQILKNDVFSRSG